MRNKKEEEEKRTKVVVVLFGFLISYFRRGLFCGTAFKNRVRH